MSTDEVATLRTGKTTRSGKSCSEPQKIAEENACKQRLNTKRRRNMARMTSSKEPEADLAINKEGENKYAGHTGL